MTDRELLEAAAKAAGVHANQWAEPDELLPDKGGWVQFIGYGKCSIWNPLTDDGDALRLMVKLQLDPYTYPNESDPYAATRRAIVRAAASIGQQAPAGEVR